MRIHYSNELYYPVECSILFTRKLNAGNNAGDYIFLPPEENLRNLRSLYGPAMEPFASSYTLVSKIMEHVWNGVHTPRERLDFFFGKEIRQCCTLGDQLAHMMCAGDSIASRSPERRFEFLRDMIVSMLEGDVPTISFRTEAELFDHIDSADCPMEIKWMLLRFYHHAEEYERELASIFLEAESLFQEKEAPLRSLWEAAIEQAGREIELHGLSYLHEHYSIKPGGEELWIYPSVMLISGAALQSSETDGRSRSYMWIGFLSDSIHSMIKQSDASEEALSSRLKVLADKRRLEILCALRKGSLCGQEIAELIGLTPATVSHHMSALLQEDFITVEKDGARYQYSLSASGIRHLLKSLEHVLLP